MTASLSIVVGAVHAPLLQSNAFYYDDWANAAAFAQASPHGFQQGVLAIAQNLGGRPVLGLMLALPYALFGPAPSLHLAYGLMLNVMTSTLLFILVRRLCDGPFAIFLSAFVLLFPWSSSVRFWPTAAGGNIALSLYLVGVLLALRALAGGSYPTALHVAASMALALGLLTYEAIGGVVLLSVLLYARVATLRVAVARWAADLAVTALAATAVISSGGRTAPHPKDVLASLPGIAAEAIQLLALSLAPLSLVPGSVLAGLLVLGGTATLATFATARGFERPQRGHGAIALFGTMVVVAGYLPFAGRGLSPLDTGVNNRINLVAAGGYGCIVYAITAILGSNLQRRVTRRSTDQQWLSVGLAALLGASYVATVRTEMQSWLEASATQYQVLDQLHRLDLPDNAHLYTFNHAAESAPGVPIFLESWDLQAALRLRLSRTDIRVFPVFRGAAFHCTQEDLQPTFLPTPYESEVGHTSRYGTTVLVDAMTGNSATIRTQAECHAALSRFVPGRPPMRY